MESATVDTINSKSQESDWYTLHSLVTGAVPPAVQDGINSLTRACQTKGTLEWANVNHFVSAFFAASDCSAEIPSPSEFATSLTGLVCCGNLDIINAS